MQLETLRTMFRVLGRMSPTIAAKIAVRLFYTPRRHPMFEWEKQLRDRGECSILASQEGKISMASWGKGPVVLLVHGWEGRGTQLGRLVTPLVEAGFRVVSFDGPAHGASPGKQTTLPRFAAVAVELCDHLGPLAGIVGHSFGAAAASIALERGVDAERVVFISPPYSFRNVVGRFASFLSIPDSVLSRMHILMEETHQCPAEALSFDSIGPRLHSPILIFHDTDDRYVPYADGVAVCSCCQQAELVTTSGLGHIRILFDNQVIQGVVDHLRGGRKDRRTDRVEPPTPATRATRPVIA